MQFDGLVEEEEGREKRRGKKVDREIDAAALLLLFLLFCRLFGPREAYVCTYVWMDGRRKREEETMRIHTVTYIHTYIPFVSML